MRVFSRQSKAADQPKSAKTTRRTQTPSGQRSAVDSVLHLQRTIGNQATQRLLAVQPKLTVSTPGDEHEQEADRVSDEVMRMPEPSPAPEHVQTKGIESSTPANAPPSVNEVLRSPGEPLAPDTRAFMEPRFGQDFSNVRLHTDQTAARSAESVSARAYTVGNHIVFGAGSYAPASQSGQRLLAHELTHVQQQQRGPALQRQPLTGDQSQEIPTELRTSANVKKLSDQELISRNDQILKVLGQLKPSSSDKVWLEQESARIGVELALRSGRTFDEESIKKMKEYFITNSQKPTKPEKNPPPRPPEGWQDSCIVALNNAMKIGTGKTDLPTTPKSIEATMSKIAGSGHSGGAREIWFESKSGKINKHGSLRPEKLEQSVWDTVISLAGGDLGWSVFTMSLLDGHHSVTLTLDMNDPAAPRLFWSDQWESKGGWKEYTHTELDEEVTTRVQKWWDKQADGHKSNTVVRVWRVTATAQTSTP